ncbi:MAG TPA: hypothetical protein VGK35_01315 [Actinotalea sp.]|jgi:hypothetical protein
MTYSTPEMVVSGVPYEVLTVDGREPADLDDFVGEHELGLNGRTGRHLVSGEGDTVGEMLKFYEKAPDGGKDVRVWKVRQLEDAGFCAESL